MAYIPLVVNRIIRKTELKPLEPLWSSTGQVLGRARTRLRTSTEKVGDRVCAPSFVKKTKWGVRAPTR